MTPVLLVHGPGRSPRSLRPLADRLAALGHVVLAPPLPHDVPGAVEAARRAQARDSPAVVVGVAGGHRAALVLAAQEPDAVARLVLTSPSPARPLRPHLLAVLRSSLREVPSLKPQLLREDLRPGLRRRVRALQEALVHPVPIGAVRAPSTVVVGERDAAVPVSAARQLADALPDGRLVVVDGAAHELHWSAPHLLARLVDGVVRDDRPEGAVLVPLLGADDPLAPPRRVPVAAHAALDLVGAGLALGLPRLLGWGRPTRRVLAAAAVAELVSSGLTEHPNGVLPRLPVPLHLNLDSGGGLLLLAAAALLRHRPAPERAAVAALGLAGVALADLSSAPVGPARLETQGPGQVPQNVRYAPKLSGAGSA